jgi:hypothetical protein
VALTKERDTLKADGEQMRSELSKAQHVLVERKKHLTEVTNNRDALTSEVDDLMGFITERVNQVSPTSMFLILPNLSPGVSCVRRLDNAFIPAAATRRDF